MQTVAYAASVGHSVWFSYDTGETWNRAHTNTGGIYNESRCWCLSTHADRPGEVLSGTDIGVYRWDPAAARWNYVASPMDGMHILQIVQHPHDADLIVAGTRPAAIYISEDGGATWYKAPVGNASECGVLSLNVASAYEALNGNADIRFASEYHRRGVIVSQDALQTSLSVNTNLGSFGLHGDATSNQSLETGSDSLDGTIGLSYNINDKINLLVGVYNSQIDSTGTTLESFVNVSLNTLFNPGVTIYRDVSDELYTFEGRLSHGFDLQVLQLGTSVVVGSTELSQADTSTYVAASLVASKELKPGLNLYADLTYSDADNREEEWLYGVGLAVKF